MVPPGRNLVARHNGTAPRLPPAVLNALRLFHSLTQLSGDNSYAGWFHALSPDGSEAYRLGYRNVVQVGCPAEKGASRRGVELPPTPHRLLSTLN